MNKDIYYHGTNLKGLLSIAKELKIRHNYGGEVGVFITPDHKEALLFGQYVLTIVNIDESKLEKPYVNNNNDGYFYRGEISSNNISHIDCNFLEDARIVKDINDFYLNNHE